MEGAPRCHRMALPGADQRERGGLRPIAPQRPLQRVASEVVRQRGALAHREHAGLGPGLAPHGGGIAAGEDVFVGDRLQVMVDRDETAFVRRQSALGESVGCVHAGHPEDMVVFDRAAVAGANRVRVSALGKELGDDFDVPRSQQGTQSAPDGSRMSRQDVHLGGDQDATRGVGKAGAHGERKLHAAGAAAYDYQAHGFAREALRHGLPARQEATDRLDGRDPVGSFQAAAGNAAGVDRQDVIAHRRSSAQPHAVRIGFHPDHLPRDEVGTGEARETRDIDVHLAAPVDAGDMPGQHARIGRFNFARDDGEAQARLGPHAEPAQYLDVAMSGTGEQDVLDGGRAASTHRHCVGKERHGARGGWACPAGKKMRCAASGRISAIASKSRSWWSNSASCSMASCAMQQSIALRTVRPRRRNS